LILTTMARTCCGRNGGGSAAQGSTATKNEAYDWSCKFLPSVESAGGPRSSLLDWVPVCQQVYLAGLPAVCQVAATALLWRTVRRVCGRTHSRSTCRLCVRWARSTIYEITFPSTDDSCLHAHKAHSLTKTFVSPGVSRGQLGCR
jgi:hypothetical protein